MKFDVLVGNPPYSKGHIPLYVRFFALALDLAEQVAMIMPVNLDSRSVDLKKHNRRVKIHNTFISEEVNQHFPHVGIGPIKYVIASNNVHNVVEEIDNPLNNWNKLYPDRSRLTCLRGDSRYDKVAEETKGTKIIFKIHKDGIVWKKVKPALVQTSNAKSSSRWLVLANHTPSNGVFNCEIVPNDGKVSWSYWVFAVEVASEASAILLQKFLNSPEVIAEVNRLLRSNGPNAKVAYTFSKEKFDLLPSYK